LCSGLPDPIHCSSCPGVKSNRRVYLRLHVDYSTNYGHNFFQMAKSYYKPGVYEVQSQIKNRPLISLRKVNLNVIECEYFSSQMILF
jgi:hypothetical protein